MDSKTKDEIVEKIAQSCRIIGQLDITHAALGHVSYRIDDTDTMLIKGKGPGEAGLRYTHERDVITVDFNANKLEGPDDLQPPSESFIHIWMYKMRPDVKSVIHVHPEHAVLLTICEKPILPIYGAYAPSGVKLAVDGIPVYPQATTITDDKMGEDFAKFVGNKSVSLMRGHGVTVVGNCVEQATLTTIALDQLTTMMYKAYLLGDPKPIRQEDIERESRPPATQRTRGSAGGTAGMLAAWRYYVTLAEDRARGASMPFGNPEPERV